ncbi:ead/Ea22-like family protein [Salmonella enterica]|nr:ead/Ea22-like family protein [Salmonella enterica]
MTALNKQALREAAEKATPGPWEMEQENIWFTDADGYTKHLMYAQQGDDVDDKQDHYNTAFIAAANPATVLTLLDDLVAAEKRIAELEHSETQLIDERDNAESALNDAYKAVMGQAPEWSNWFSFANAIDEIELACEQWRNQTDDVIQFRQRIADLEARTVTLPQQAPENLASVLDGYEKWLIATTFRDTWNACLAEVTRMNAAGIKGA